MKSRLRVSLVIPAYNEAASLRQCLDAIARQIVKPHEVIVVDNNSTDNTVAIAKEYPFVKVGHEKRQGVLYARAKGFDMARGDIIGRIDVDTIIPENWVQTVREIFAESDIAATSGKMEYHDIILKSTMNRIELSFRRWLAKSFTPTRTVFLQGASMAMRRGAWRAVRGELCERSDIHEDYDIALHLQQMGYDVSFDERLVASLSLRRVDTSLRQFLAYVRVNPHTYRIHNAAGSRHMYVVIALILIAYFPVRLLYRGYDTDTERFDLIKIFQSTSARVNPFTLRD